MWEADYESITRRGVSRDAAAISCCLRELSRSIQSVLSSPNVKDSNDEPANLIDVLGAIAKR